MSAMAYISSGSRGSSVTRMAVRLLPVPAAYPASR